MAAHNAVITITYGPDVAGLVIPGETLDVLGEPANGDEMRDLVYEALKVGLVDRALNRLPEADAYAVAVEGVRKTD